jgi:predicted lipoprotein with Yx(FWY)xxD motif
MIPGMGTVLVSGHRALYFNTGDRPGHIVCTGTCTTVWPPLTVSAAQSHHLGKLHGLKTFRRPGGHLQVSFHGHPLYFFTGDHSLNAASGQGFLNIWFAVRPNGKAVPKVSSPASAPAPAPAPANGTTTTTTTSGAPNGGGNGGMGSGSAGHGSSAGTPTTNPPANPPPANPPTTTTPPPPPPPTTTTSPPPTTTTTVGSGGGVSF